MPQVLLKLRVAPETQLRDEAGHRRRADAGPLGKPGHAFEAGDGVTGEQHPGEPPLGRGEAVEALADELADAGGACMARRYVGYVLPQSASRGNVLDDWS